METLRKLTIVIVLVCLICNGASFGEEPAKAKPELKFVYSTSGYKLNSSQRGGYGRSYGGGGRNEGVTETSNIDKSKKIKPTHVAFMGKSYQLFVPSCFEPDALLKTPSGQSMSDLQKEFVKQGNACKVDFLILGKPILRTHLLRKTHLFAVTEDDAKKMAAAFIESWQNNMGAEVQKFLEKKKEFEKKAPELRKRCAEKRKEFDELEKTLKEKSSKGLHSLDGNIVHNSKAKDDARQAARQLYLKLNSANIEIEVIKARLSAATVYQARENANPTVQTKLEDILCEQTIELAGALERQAGITNTLRQEEEFYRLYVQFNEAGERLNEYARGATSAEKKLKRATEEFENIDSSYPGVKDNKGVIRPVVF
ncbi:MAG: hypothetical protein FVQ79_09315 [Planctomycetes bacterium]|nr:hypothetical protein [Planctomycetota bacterium]